MAHIPANQLLQPPVLDRLLSGGSSDPNRSAFQRLRDLKRSLERDLEALLNTRWRCTTIPADLAELEQSIVNYGIPDFTGASFSNPTDRVDFQRVIKRAIERFEPRLKNITVKLLDNDDPSDRTLRFKIDAMIEVDPVPEPIVFESRLEPSTSTFEVKQAAK